jgi:hypothetical protein
MDKKNKQRRHKTLDRDEIEQVAPHGASFDTEEGRAAQGMRPDIGTGRSDEERRRDEKVEGAVGASDGTSGGGNATGIPDGDTAAHAGEAVTQGDVKDDRGKLFPDAKTDVKKTE